MVAGAAANVSDLSQAHALLHVQKEVVLGDACYRRVGMCPENAARQVNWYAAIKRGVCKALTVRLGRMKKWMESVKASLRARGKHPFRVIKSQFGYVNVRYRGLARNTTQLMILFAMNNLWMV